MGKTKVIINGETAIKPYYYVRGKYIHVRYTVDRCVELSSTEEAQLKSELEGKPSDKQNVLAKAWNFFTQFVGKSMILDGIAVADKVMEVKRNGQQN